LRIESSNDDVTVYVTDNDALSFPQQMMYRDVEIKLQALTVYGSERLTSLSGRLTPLSIGKSES
jgi:hypothetical protein